MKISANFAEYVRLENTGENLGEPKKKIDLHQLEHCAEKQWTITEIAAHFRVNEKTIRRRFARQIEEARQRGRTRLRDLQWQRAEQGSDKMIIHMSKHHLDQHETQKLEHSGSVAAPTQLTEEELKIKAAELQKKLNELE